METGDHSKNGAYPKSLMSRINLLRISGFILFVAATFGFNACNSRPGNNTPTQATIEKQPRELEKAPSVNQNKKIYANGANIEMVKVEGGTITTPDGRTLVVETFWIGKYEITEKQWSSICKRTVSMNGYDWYDVDYYGSIDNYPYQINTCYDVSPYEYVNRLNDIEDSDFEFYIPTIEEWEYAARGGIHGHGYEYPGSNNLNEVAWYSSNSQDALHVVGKLKANELGIYDMCGNVAELVSWKEIGNGGIYYTYAGKRIETSKNDMFLWYKENSYGGFCNGQGFRIAMKKR